jgi:hypothetical protein
MDRQAKKWDAFISHAIEDQATFVRDLAIMLTRLGLSVWYSETALQVGDSLSASIDGRSLILLRGEIQHKNLWLIDLETGAERQLTHLAPEYDIQDFDISPDGGEVVIERLQERSNLVLLDLECP